MYNILEIFLKKCVSLSKLKIGIEIVMAMTQRAYAQYVHIHGNKTQGDKISDNNETRMRRMVSVSLCACVNSPTFPAKAEASSLYPEERWRRWERVYTSLQAEIQVLLDDPANFYNIVMSNSGIRPLFVVY